MKYLFLLSFYLIPFNSSALPTLFVGETARITKDDVDVITHFYKQENGVDKYAVIAYEVEYPLYGTQELTELDIQLTGEITSPWYSSNFGMIVTVYCNNVEVESDTAYGLRYERASYIVKPQFRIENHSIAAGCESVKVRMEKLGSIARMYFTDIENIDLRLYMTTKF